MYLDRVKNQLIELKLIRQDELVGCTRDEVMAIQQRLDYCAGLSRISVIYGA